MSQALQRVMVRMLYDPGLVSRVYDGAPLPELSDAERGMLVAVDRRAWGTDPMRRMRTLTALLAEFPASAALAGPGLDGFFGSTEFHQSIQERTHLALAFGAWLEARVGPVGTLERGAAEARRDPRERVHAPGRVARAPGVRVAWTPVGALARLEAVRARLGRDPVAALARGRLRLDGLPALGATREVVLIEADAAGQVQLSTCTEALAGLLIYAATPRTVDELHGEIRRLGADPGEEAEILSSVRADGLLVPVK